MSRKIEQDALFFVHSFLGSFFVTVFRTRSAQKIQPETFLIQTTYYLPKRAIALSVIRINVLFCTQVLSRLDFHL